LSIHRKGMSSPHQWRGRPGAMLTRCSRKHVRGSPVMQQTHEHRASAIPAPSFWDDMLIGKPPMSMAPGQSATEEPRNSRINGPNGPTGSCRGRSEAQPPESLPQKEEARRAGRNRPDRRPFVGLSGLSQTAAYTGASRSCHYPLFLARSRVGLGDNGARYTSRGQGRPR
jgi:hypothetical protein